MADERLDMGVHSLYPLNHDHRGMSALSPGLGQVTLHGACPDIDVNPAGLQLCLPTMLGFETYSSMGNGQILRKGTRYFPRKVHNGGLMNN